MCLSLLSAYFNAETTTGRVSFCAFNGNHALGSAIAAKTARFTPVQHEAYFDDDPPSNSLIAED